MKSRIRFIVFLSALMAACFSHAQDSDAARGKVLAQMCIGCHSESYNRVTFPSVYNIPLIRGQSAEYIKYALAEYASGNRYTDEELNKLATMPAIAASLSEQDMADLAAYYSVFD